jgi:ABC-type lipoprotein export system ATPase subunit
MIETKGLSYQYDKGNVIQFEDFSIKAGETLLILGKSGVGKTTLLHLLALLLKPKTGKITINNVDITTLKTSELVAFRAQNIGLVFQKPHFVSSLSVKENLLLPNYFAGKSLEISHLNNLASSLGFENYLHKKTNQLSLGEQQRVAIARAIMNSPKIILADEPTSSLDDENCKNVLTLLENQAQKINACLVIVTHDQRLKNEFSNQITL